MQSDQRTMIALSALAEPCARFRNAVETARDQMRAYLATHRTDSDDRAANVTRELGSFASGRIDTNRFSSVFSKVGSVDYQVFSRIERCIAVLDDVLARGDDLFIVDVPKGGNVQVAVDTAFALAGRAFGAVLAFQAAKTGSYRDDQHDRLLDSFPFARWNRSERLIAPPLVVEVDGQDFGGEQLTAFIDGSVRIIAVIRGPSSPAPLARLITPGVLVVESAFTEQLSKLAGFDGPAVAALVPEGASTFVHDPRAGPVLHDRLLIDHLAGPPGRSLGSRSAWQQREELAHLTLLSKIAAEENAQVDTLATWLLNASGFNAAQPEG
jgi:hypothetical protein